MTPPDVIVDLLVDTHRDSSGEGTVPFSIGTMPALTQLFDEARRAGCDVVRAADFDGASAARPALLWDFGSVSVLPAPLAATPFDGVVAWSLESPLVADRAYRRLRQIARSSTSLHTYAGARALLRGQDNGFHDLHWPTDPRPTPDTGWSARRFLCLLNSNKRAHAFRGVIVPSEPRASARRLAAAGLARVRRRVGWSVPDLYAERVRAIRHFSNVEGFTLYGIGWDEPVDGLTLAEHAALQERYGGAPAEKHSVLAQHRFSLCFENTSFEGYVSEKLFDCLFAGTIPIYLGAPDITSYVPPACFIDGRSFADYRQLETHLQALDDEGAADYLGAAKAFIESPKFERFRPEAFVDQIGRALGVVAT